MFKQKSGQVYRNKIIERMFNTLSRILESVAIGFPTRNNAQYWIGESAAILMKMSESHIASEEAIRLLKHAEKKMPSPKWFHNMVNSLESDSADYTVPNSEHLSLLFNSGHNIITGFHYAQSQ